MSTNIPDGWRFAALGDVCKLPERQIRPSEFSRFRYYLGLEHIEGDTGRVLEYQNLSGTKLKSSKFPFDESCILYGKLRPYLNKVALPEVSGICSTDILPLRPIPSQVLREYLYYYLRSPFFVKIATMRSTGANLPRITPETLLRMLIPVPPMETQRLISDALKRVDRLKEKRDQANQLTSKIVQSVFLKMFGDPATNPKGWDSLKLSEVCRKVTDGTHVTPNYTETGIPFLSVKDVRNGRLDFSDTKFISREQHEELTKRSRPEFGDILYTKVGTVGIAALVDTKKEFSIFVSVALLKPEHTLINSGFLWAMLNSQFVKAQAHRRVKGIGVPDLHLVEIKDFDILLPPMEMQRKFAERLNRIQSLRERQQESTHDIDKLFHSLMHKAFRGELRIAKASSA